jgi:hypothetical protein
MKSECKNCGYHGLYKMITDISPADLDAFLEFLWSGSNEPATLGNRSCTLYVDGREIASSASSDGDPRAIMLGQWFASAFKDELMDRKMPIDGSCGLSDVAEMIQDCRFRFQLMFSKNEYEAYRLSKIPDLPVGSGL